MFQDFATLFLGNLVSFDDLQIKTNSEIPWIILQYIHKKRWRQYLEDSIKHWNSKKIIKCVLKNRFEIYFSTIPSIIYISSELFTIC